MAEESPDIIEQRKRRVVRADKVFRALISTVQAITRDACGKSYSPPPWGTFVRTKNPALRQERFEERIAQSDRLDVEAIIEETEDVPSSLLAGLPLEIFWENATPPPPPEFRVIEGGANAPDPDSIAVGAFIPLIVGAVLVLETWVRINLESKDTPGWLDFLFAPQEAGQLQLAHNEARDCCAVACEEAIFVINRSRKLVLNKVIQPGDNAKRYRRTAMSRRN